MGKTKVIVKDVDGGLEGAPLWITTFVDMTSLLVTFFILLFTFSSIRDYDAFSYPKSLVGTSGTFEGQGENDIVAPNDDIMQAYDLVKGARRPHARPATELPESIEDMGQKLTDDHLEVDLNHAKNGLRMQFSPEASFAPSSAHVSPALRRSLHELGQTMQYYPHTILIEGYTDANFRPNDKFRTEEELSFARAMAAAQVLRDETEVPAELIQVAGRGSSPLRSTDPGSAVERRLDRRIEVVIVAMERSRAKLYEQEVAK